MESLQTVLEWRPDFTRDASNSASIDLFLCLPQPAHLRISHPSTTDHIPTIRADSFQSGRSDSGLDCLEIARNKTAFGPPASYVSDCDLRLRCKRPTGRFRRPAQSILSPARRR